MLDLMNAKQLSGRVRVWNEDGDSVEGWNLVTYLGCDCLVRLLAGDITYKIANFAFEYQNTAGTPAPAPAARSDTNALLQALAGSFDYLRGPLVSTPVLSASSGLYNANRATMTALSVATTGVHGVAFSAGSNSKIYSVSLLASPTGAAAGDLIYARYILPSALPAVGSGQVGASWMVGAD